MKPHDNVIFAELQGTIENNIHDAVKVRHNNPLGYSIPFWRSFNKLGLDFWYYPYNICIDNHNTFIKMKCIRSVCEKCMENNE